MKTIQNLLLAFLFFASALLVSCEKADSKAVTPQVPDQLMEKYDQDQNGVFSEDERKKMNTEFVNHFDNDQDGTLNAAERAKARKAGKVKVSVNRTAPMTLENAQSFIKRLDKDNDGSLAKSELDETRWKVMQRADSNRDGAISAGEWLESRTQ